MAGKPHLIKITSLKGGIGKTTFAINFAIALKSFGCRVLLVDADWVNPNIGYYLGLEEPEANAKDILLGNASLSHAKAVHKETGLEVMLPRMMLNPFMPTKEMMFRFMEKLPRLNYDFIVMDIPHDMSLLEDMQVEKYEDNFIITTPDRIACASALRLEAFYDKRKAHSRVIANRSDDKRYELSDRELPELFQGKKIASFPYEKKVRVAASIQRPAYIYAKRSRFNKLIRSFTLDYLHEKGHKGTRAPTESSQQAEYRRE